MSKTARKSPKPISRHPVKQDTRILAFPEHHMLLGPKVIDKLRILIRLASPVQPRGDKTDDNKAA